jgi:chorismate-pyruvate lyase
VAAADAIGIADWLERVDRGEWFTAADPELQALQVLAITHGASTRQVLGVSQGERAMTTLRNLLALAGYRLEAKRNLEEGDRVWLYRVVAEPLCRTGPTCPIKGIQLTFTR